MCWYPYKKFTSTTELEIYNVPPPHIIWQCFLCLRCGWTLPLHDWPYLWHWYAEILHINISLALPTYINPTWNQYLILWKVKQTCHLSELHWDTKKDHWSGRTLWSRSAKPFFISCIFIIIFGLKIRLEVSPFTSYGHQHRNWGVYLHSFMLS